MASTPEADRDHSTAPARHRRAGATVARLSRGVALGAALAAAAAGADETYRAEIVARAESLALHEAPRWRALLHYGDDFLGAGVTSYLDAAGFFLAAEGKRDPQAELAATLGAFFAPDPEGDVQHPQCAFAARYRWLREQLGFDPARLPERACPRYRTLRDLIEPTGATLVFPEAFLNNPASMFGHTLLRIDVTESAEQRDLLAWAIDFSADTGDESGAVFAIKGMIGAYPGHFNIHPYYEKVKQYGDWENRDIWEYRLDLAPDEIEWILLHLWELQGVHADYYYFGENCSFHLLGLIEVARPGLALGEGFGPWVIPADTVRAVARQAGLVKEVQFRPSAATRLRAQHRGLSRAARVWVRDLAEGRREPAHPGFSALSDRERAAALSLAHDWLRYRFLAGELSREESLPRARRLLVARSRIELEGDALAPVSTPPVSPERGHATARVALGAGWRGDRPVVELRLRPSLHALIDPPGGYLRGAQIQLGELALHFEPRQGRLRVHEALLVDIVSLAPRGPLLRPLSWKLSAGLRTRRVRNGGEIEDGAVARGEAGVGLAFDLHPQLLAYGFAEAVIDAGRDLERSHALGPGASAGLLVGIPGDRWGANLSARVLHFALGDRGTKLRVGLDQRLTLGGPFALELDAGYERAYDDDWFEALARLHLYF